MNTEIKITSKIHLIKIFTRLKGIYDREYPFDEQSEGELNVKKRGSCKYCFCWGRGTTIAKGLSQIPGDKTGRLWKLGNSCGWLKEKLDDNTWCDTDSLRFFLCLLGPAVLETWADANSLKFFFVFVGSECSGNPRRCGQFEIFFVCWFQLFWNGLIFHYSRPINLSLIEFVIRFPKTCNKYEFACKHLLMRLEINKHSVKV